MSSAPTWSFRIRHVLEAIARIRRYTAGRDAASFAAVEMAVDAVVRNFQVLGEAARHVPDTIRAAHPGIAWSSMERMRHVLVHDYYKVDLAILWQTIQHDLPPLVEPLERVLAENPDP